MAGPNETEAAMTRLNLTKKETPLEKPRSFVIGTLSVVFLVTASNAQQASGGQKRHQQKTDRSATQTTAKADEKAYNAALKSIPNKPYDPWFGTR
jgi:hypothetical protein